MKLLALQIHRLHTQLTAEYIHVKASDGWGEAPPLTCRNVEHCLHGSPLVGILVETVRMTVLALTTLHSKL